MTETNSQWTRIEGTETFPPENQVVIVTDGWGDNPPQIFAYHNSGYWFIDSIIYNYAREIDIWDAKIESITAKECVRYWHPKPSFPPPF